MSSQISSRVDNVAYFCMERPFWKRCKLAAGSFEKKIMCMNHFKKGHDGLSRRSNLLAWLQMQKLEDLWIFFGLGNLTEVIFKTNKPVYLMVTFPLRWSGEKWKTESILNNNNSELQHCKNVKNVDNYGNLVIRVSTLISSITLIQYSNNSLRWSDKS